MFCFFISLLLLIGSEAQDNGYNSANEVFYTPYGSSNQFRGHNQEPNPVGDPGYHAPFVQKPCGRSLESGSLDVQKSPLEPTGNDAQQPPNTAVPEAPCDKPGSESMPLEELCSLPPHKGDGDDDIFRYYYNPVVQQCIPFSYSGKGGNANRFVSVKNCYEICHPADPTVKKPRVVSGIKAYLVPNLKADCKKETKNSNEVQFDRKKGIHTPREVVIRQIPHPLDPSKTLTIIQNAQYITADGKTPNSSPNNEIDPNVRRLYQYEDVPQFMTFGR